MERTKNNKSKTSVAHLDEDPEVRKKYTLHTFVGRTNLHDSMASPKNDETHDSKVTLISHSPDKDKKAAPKDAIPN